MFMMPFRLPWQNIPTSTKGKGTIKKKSRIRETKNLSIDVDRRTDTILGRLRDLSRLHA